MDKLIALFAEITAEDERIYGERLAYKVCRAEGPLTESTLASFCPAALRNAEVLSVMVNSRVTKAVLDRMPNLRLIAARSTGYDHIDCQEAARRGIEIATVPEYGCSTVAEYTFGLILNLSRHIHKAHFRALTGDFTYEGLMGTDLSGKTLGIVGLGRIGRHVARIGGGFEMRVVAFDPVVDREDASQAGAELVDFPTLLSSTDFIAVCCPLTVSTRHLFNDETFAHMKPGASLVNTARGPIVDPSALLRALKSGRVGAAALDVLEAEDCVNEEAALAALDSGHAEAVEALARNLALIRHPNVIATPHMAYFSKEALERIRETTIRNIEGFRAGSPQNLIRVPCLV